MGDLEDFESAENCIKVLIKYGCKLEISNKIFEENCNEYMNNSQYLKDTLLKCKSV